MTLPQPAPGKRLPAAGAGALLVAATGALWVVSRGKWSDALIDSGREWIVPDALARGGLLYRDVVYWFGPLTPYLHALLFRAFGATFSTLVLAGVAASGAILAALYFALRQVTGRLQSILWTAVAVPALVFMPHAGGPLLGMGYRIWHAAGFSLAAVAVASLERRGRSVWKDAMAGALCAAAALCRLEWGLAALAAVTLAVALGARAGRAWQRGVAAVAAAFVLIAGGVIALFVLVSGRQAVIVESHVLLTGLPDETRTFLMAFSGVRDWRRGLAELLYSSAMWVGAALLVEVLALWKSDPALTRRRAKLFVAVLPMLVIAALFGGASGAVTFSAAPLLCLLAFLAGCRKPGPPSSAAIAAFGLLGMLLSYRRPFHIGDSAYVGPPLLFAFVSAAGLLARRVESLDSPQLRHRLRRGHRAALACLVAVAFAARLRHYAAWEGVAIDGTAGLLTARAELASDLSSLARAIREGTEDGDALVVFPEGEVLNYLSGRRNPLRHKLYIPGYLSDANEDEVLAELGKARPAAIVVWTRPSGEYGRGLFGQDYGVRIARWIEDNYSMRPFEAVGAAPRRNRAFRYGLRRGTVPGPPS